MSRHTFRLAALGVVAAAVAAFGACSDSTAPGSGAVQVMLTDAPFSSDSVSRVDVFVIRVDAKTQEADSSEAARATFGDSLAASEWKTLATPNRSIELLALRNGVTTTLGLTALPAGSYRAFRLVIDPSLSSVTLKNGAILTSGSSPNVTFPSAARSGIKIKLDQPIEVTAGDTTKALIDFDVNESFVLRGSSIATSGLTFRPVIRAKEIL